MSGNGKVSVRYFTGTGNSKRIAQMCAGEFESAGRVVDIAPINEKIDRVEGDSMIAFVFPVYSLDLPRIAKRYLEGLPKAQGRPRAFLLVTGGNADDCGWSLLEGRRILRERGYDPVYADLVQMPNNWGPFMRVPPREEALALLASGEEKARTAARSFLSGESFIKALSLPVFGPLGSRLIRSLFKRGVKKLWKFFRTSDACSSCSLCARSCPTKSITMEQGRRGERPRWSSTCEQCMRCFNACPSRAILQLEAIGHGSRKERWLEPSFEVRK